MTLIVCVDDELGMAFYGKRQSRDRRLCEDMLAFAQGKRIRMDPRSAKLFEGLDGKIAADEDAVKNAETGECCFVEFEPVSELAQRARTLVLYRWNRHYPADLYFDISLDGWEQVETTQFPGTSHETITREVYVHENK